MERRLLLAIALMVGLMALSNVIFPPVRQPVTGADSVSVGGPAEAASRPESLEAPGGAPATAREATATVAEEMRGDAGDAAAMAMPAANRELGEIVTVRSDLYEYRFNTRGAALVGATIKAYPDFAPDRGEDGPVELLRPNDTVLAWTITTRGDTLRLADVVFQPSAMDVEVGRAGTELRFSTPLAGGVTFDIVYRFSPTNYGLDISGGLRNFRDEGYTIGVGLGRGLRSNEATPREDFAQMAVVTRGRASGAIVAERLDRLDPGERRVVDGGPFSWAASKSKYFLAAVVSAEDGPGFGGVVLQGLDEPNAAEIAVTLPVPAGSDGFRLIGYVGPQDFERLQAIGQELQNVNPFGWKILQWFIRPFGGLVIAFLVWMHGAFSLAYGWVLILFGVIARIVLFPLYQMSMRQQMKQMGIQPEIKKVQQKYKEDPQKLQQETMKIYKESGVNPLGGCLPMLVPFPILITLFFVFQNTIEFRGVPFLWVPDLSLSDPLYIVPLLMGGSMLLLNWIGQRGMETNQQMKIMTYVLPVVFTFMFARFAAGLNLYYAASNLASLPQQLYLSRERRAAQAGGGRDAGGAGAKKDSGPARKWWRAAQPIWGRRR